MSNWIENMRRWIHDRLLQPLVEQIQNVDKKLKQNMLEDYDCYHPLDSPPSLSTKVPPNTPPPLSGKYTLRHILLHNCKGNPVLMNRLKIEEYLEIPNCNRKYLITRLSSI